MRDCREEWYDEQAKVKITFADVTDAAQRLAAGHLCGPASAHFLAEHLAAAALFAAETSEPDETLILQLKCTGPLGGITVECTAGGTLRGFTEKKTLDEFDGLGRPDPRKIIGERRYQITRSVPGRIISQGVSTTLGGYLTQSLQRNAEIKVDASVTDAVEVSMARGALVEILPDSQIPRSKRLMPASTAFLSNSSRTMLKKLGFPNAELKKTTPLSFACRCSPERAAAMLAALSPEERASLPQKIDITCHMCGRTFSIPCN